MPDGLVGDDYSTYICYEPIANRSSSFLLAHFQLYKFTLKWFCLETRPNGLKAGQTAWELAESFTRSHESRSYTTSWTAGKLAEQAA